MEPEVVKRRGRKRKRKDGGDADKTAKKTVVGKRSKVFIGRYVKKEFDGSGEFLGKIVSYETGLYRVDYEDGDCEDLESRELKGVLVEENEMDCSFRKRKKALDDYIKKKYAKDEAVRLGDAANKVETLKNDSDAVGNSVKSAKPDKVETMKSDGCVVDNGVELADADKVESCVPGECTGAEAEVDSETSSDLSDYEQAGDVIEVVSPAVPPPQLPPSSGNFGVPEEHVSYLLSVYSFLRSFSVCLFLSPFGLDEFVGALNSSVHNTLLDAIHVALVRALKSYVEILSSEGSELASKCLRSMDWSLLDSLTWPAFVVQYLTTMRYAEGHEWKEFYINALEKDYYTLSAGRKLAVLQLLCDDASNSAELRAEIDMRESSEVGPDPDGVVLNDENIPRRGRPSVNPVLNDEYIPRRRGRPPKASLPKDQEDVKDGNLVLNDGNIPRKRGRPPKESLSKDQEDVKDISGNHVTTVSSAPNSLVSKANVSASSSNADDVDDDGNGDECRLCGMDGTLVCCDGCPSSYHSRCIGVMKMFIPQGEWYCPECTINRIGPIVSKTTSLRGAELFGIDPYEQVFLGACDHLLVMKTSRSTELHIQYYSPADIQKVLNALTSSAEYMTLYLEICKGILKYWEIPESIFSLSVSIGMDNDISNKFGEYSKGSGDPMDVINAGNVNGVAEYDSKDTVTASSEENYKEFGLSQVTLDESTTRISENGNYDNKSSMNNVSELLNISSSHKKEAYLGIPSSDEKLYMGTSFKPQAYLNVYIHGDFAASAGANLAIFSSEEKLASQPQASSSHRKFMSANYSLQAKAFSLAAKRFYWPNYEKKLVEVSRERCGWCLSCKSSINSKRGCLLNAAASNAIKGAAKILVSLRQSKNVDGTLASIATYVMFMEESLCGLTVGPFQNSSYRNVWCKQVEEAATLGEIKAYLLEFERNIRDIAFSADWIRIVDDKGFESQVTQSAKSVVGSSQKRGPGRRGRKPSILIPPPEITEVDGKELSTDFAWWRGGRLSKHIFQKGVLPKMLVKHAARRGGCGKINGVHYVDGFEVPKRSRQFLWRAAVDMSKTTSQLALQVRYLDLHVRWNELVCPEQPLQDGKGPEAEASAFRNACIVDKKITGNKICYGVIFENQKHLPSRVLKKVLEVEETGDKKEKNWFYETHIPLYLIKDYEMKTIRPMASKDVTKLASLPKKKLKSGKNIFSFLMQKSDNMGKCFCTTCQHDVPFRIAARCNACQGYCHEQCAVGSSIQMAGSVDFLITCKRCCLEKEVARKNEIVGDSPTSPLLLQGQESQHPATVIKAGKQNGYEKPLDYMNLSSQKKLHTSNQVKKSKSGKKNGKTVDQSSTKSSKKKSSKSNKLCLGLIWKKRNPQDTGIDFRLNNLILKNNPNHHLSGPVCHLCSKPYNSGLMYIQCEKCNNWYHAESVELEESKIMELYGFKCCRCRRIRIPICPYTDPEMREKLEKKKASLAKIQKQKILGSDYDSDSESNDDELMNDLELDAANTPVFESEEAVYVQEANHFYSYAPVDEQVNHNKLQVGYDPDVGLVSGIVPVPKKLPVRRHMKSEKEPDISTELPATYDPNPAAAGDSLAPTVEWNVSTNGFQDDMMFDYESLNYEDMEFEPQTYFSFNELLASDDVDQDPPGNMEENTVNPSTEDCNPEQYEMGITYDQQEPMFSVESGLDMFPCKYCSQTDPCPDLFCQTCGLWVHQHCSPWEEDSSWEPESGWKCGNCREWS